jgi:hypothetical protein
MQFAKARYSTMGLVLLILFLYGCTASVETIPETTLPWTITPEIVIENTSTQPPETSSTATNTTSTETPGFISDPSETPTVGSTWTPVPTLSEEDKQVSLIKLFSTNGGCDFPCWWGIQPGSPIQEIFTLSPVLGKNPSSYGSRYSYAPTFDELNLHEIDASFFERKGIVQRIEVNLHIPFRLANFLEIFEDTLSINSILNRYGKPTDVLLLVVPRAEIDSPIGYSLMLIYETKGFEIAYDGIVNTEEPIQICPGLNDFHLRYISLHLQDSHAMSDLRRISLKNNFKSIETVAPIDLEDFSQAFSSNENKVCIETTLDAWR